MRRPGRYPPEVRERAVRMVLDHQDDHPSQWAAIRSIADRFGMTHETLRRWSARPRPTRASDPASRPMSANALKELEREDFELRRANEILKSASAFFAAELDRPPTR